MATQLFFRQNSVSNGSLTPGMHLGTDQAKRDGTNDGWSSHLLHTARPAAGSAVSENVNTVNGATNGIEFDDANGNPIHWISGPLDQDVTISGTITLNLWGSENNMSANAAINAQIDRIDKNGNVVSNIATTARTTELAVATAAVNNFTVTPTSTAMQKGDRIRVVVYCDDAGTMATGFIATFNFGTATSGGTGDSWIQFNETFGIQATEPNGTKLYLTDVAGPAIGSNVEKEMWTSAGDGTTATASSTAVVGWTAPIQVTVTGGGTAIEWYSKQVQAFTLADLVRINVWAHEGGAGVNSSLRAELAVVDDDGSNAVVWGAATLISHNLSVGMYQQDPTFNVAGELTTTSSPVQAFLSGDDLSVTDGQRLRLRLYIDDCSDFAMGSGGVTVTYDENVDDATGDSWIMLDQSISEFASGPTGTATATEAADTSTASGTAHPRGSAAAAETADTSTATGQLRFIATATATETADTSTATGIGPMVGTSTAAETADTSTASALLRFIATSTAAETADTSSASGTFSSGPSGSATATETADTSTASGLLSLIGSSTATEAADTSSATGIAGSGPVGTATATEGSDTAFGWGWVGNGPRVVHFHRSIEWSPFDAPSSRTIPNVQWQQGDRVVVVLAASPAAVNSTFGTPSSPNLSSFVSRVAVNATATEAAVRYWMSGPTPSAQSNETITVPYLVEGDAHNAGVVVLVIRGIGSMEGETFSRSENSISIAGPVGSTQFVFAACAFGTANHVGLTGSGFLREHIDLGNGVDLGFWLGEWGDITTASSTLYGLDDYTGMRVTQVVARAEIWRGTSARTEANDTSTASGTFAQPITGSAAASEGNDTSTASGTMTVIAVGTAAATETADTSTATGLVRFIGSSTATETADTPTATGLLRFIGSSARTEANDVSTASGTSTPPPITGTVAASEANDTSTATGISGLLVTGTATALEGVDVGAATGFMRPNPVGTVAVTEERDNPFANGHVPISQELVDRRKRRGGFEPPTRPAERRDFFDVRRRVRNLEP